MTKVLNISNGSELDGEAVDTALELEPEGRYAGLLSFVDTVILSGRPLPGFIEMPRERTGPFTGATAYWHSMLCFLQLPHGGGVSSHWRYGG